MVKLICDLNISARGHNASYIQYIVDNVHVKNDDEVYFLFNKSARKIIDISNSSVNHNNFYFSESDFGDHTILEKLKVRDWKIIEYYAHRLKISELFLMDVNMFEIQIGRRKVPFKISGILFRPSHRIASSNKKMSGQLRSKVKKYKKYFLESFLLRSKSIENLFILNDNAGVDSLNNIHKTHVFKYLSDPIFDYKQSEKSSETIASAISQDRIVFLIFGEISPRKNIKNILESFTLLDKDIQKKIALLIIGRVPHFFIDTFDELIKRFTTLNPDIELVIIKSFVSNSEMEYYFSISDISLLIYADFYGSSGLIGRAAKYNMISLVPNVGLLSELCSQYKLGYPCDPYSVTDISNKMAVACNDIAQSKRIDGSLFYTEHSPRYFLNILNF